MLTSKPNKRIGKVRGIIRPHLCLYGLFRLLKSFKIKYSVRSSGLRGAQTCAPFALKRTGKLSHSLRHKKAACSNATFCGLVDKNAIYVTIDTLFNAITKKHLSMSKHNDSDYNR